MARSSNENRARRRRECREALAQHIYDRLGLCIAPAEVRLQPSYEDGYAWAVTSQKAHLLECSLSNGTVGLYNAICEELNKSIEAVHSEAIIADITVCSNEDKQLLQTTSQGDESFTGAIQRLERENNRLRDEIDSIQHHIERTSYASHTWKTRCGQLERDNLRQKSLIEELQSELNSVRGSISEAIRRLEQHYHGGKGRSQEEMRQTRENHVPDSLCYD